MKDLGTYFVRVIFTDGNGFIMQWNTGARYTMGSGDCSPLDAFRIKPIYNNENDLLENVRYMFFEGNWSCDCNKKLFLARALQQDDPEETPCGETMMIEKLTVIRPDGSEIDVAEKP